MLHILYFARLRDEVNCNEETLAWDEQLQTVDHIKKRLSQRDNTWQHALNDNILCAVNQRIVNAQHPIKDGDEIAFFPPVTGG